MDDHAATLFVRSMREQEREYNAATTGGIWYPQINRLELIVPN